MIEYFKKALDFTNTCIAPIVLWIEILSAIIWYFGLIPYEINVERKTKVATFIQQFPGQKVRFGVDPVDDVKQKDISEVQWMLRKGRIKIDLDNLNGFFPTIILPPEGGIYTVEATAMVNNNPYKSNPLNFYITQDDNYQILTFKEKESHKLASIRGPKYLHEQFESEDIKVEVLSKDDKWVGLKVDSDNNVIFEPGTSVKSINNKIFIKQTGETAIDKHQAIETSDFQSIQEKNEDR